MYYQYQYPCTQRLQTFLFHVHSGKVSNLPGKFHCKARLTLFIKYSYCYILTDIAQCFKLKKIIPLYFKRPYALRHLAKFPRSCKRSKRFLLRFHRKNIAFNRTTICFSLFPPVLLSFHLQGFWLLEAKPILIRPRILYPQMVA